jgi:radical SAM protein with 4Fe4S-binding SPASM domain
MELKKQTPLTLHMRMTKACNADCSYCSSWQESPDNRMSFNDFKESIDQTILLTKKLNLGTTHVCLQYIGGEILTYSMEELTRCVEYARATFISHGYIVLDGVQSNLIGSNRRVKGLFKLFQGRVGTSIDSFSGARTVNGSKDQYDLIFSTRDTEVHNGIGLTPAVYTFDASMLDNVMKEFQKAEKDRRNLTVKGVFLGGKEVDKLSPEIYERVMIELLSEWFLNSKVILEPFFSLLQKHLLNNHQVDGVDASESCHFQSNCASRSMNIEPNGDLYVCQDLADKGVGRLGNLLNNEFDIDEWEKINKRSENLNSDCLECDFLKSCRSGCMVDAIESGAGLYGKSPYCSLWKSTFRFFDLKIEKEGISNVVRWAKRLNVSR